MNVNFAEFKNSKYSTTIFMFLSIILLPALYLSNSEIVTINVANVQIKEEIEIKLSNFSVFR